MYPNPVKDYQIIESGPQISEAILLYNLSGKLVLRSWLQTQTQRLSTSFLPSELYLWNIQYHGKTIEQGKWTKE
ncbi:MAG TPA: T9SS type A sorting domain-containing protein [Bacteroidales bacterium]|nr:T9SS type A sorting domain-containing protein [Bacteroidales bacterium]MDI9573916.1 T9SS type A sorting domain-containing protein [Bacteroidota bacterium]MBP9512033.1 T9SS type A sorting domain-containing protein [Bacteroidales bacterium]MBP9588487.1 T9SS type A sorting domain-containing protein [Bacteroidales bacterium]NMD16347.1 T9SS type A sorting domain-containing protein [Bacteroidales bacterium]